MSPISLLSEMSVSSLDYSYAASSRYDRIATEQKYMLNPFMPMSSCLNQQEWHTRWFDVP